MVTSLSRPFWTICIIFLINFSVIFAQSTKIRIFPFPGDKSLFVWNTDNDDSDYLAQFVLKDGSLEGTNFPIYSDELIAFNSYDEFIVTKTYDFPGTEFWPSSSTIKAKIYHSVDDTANSFTVRSITWPECGIDYLGFEVILLGFNQNFLYIDQFNGFISGQFFNSSGEQISYFSKEGNAYHIAADVLPDSSYLVVWFNARFDGFLAALPYGIYAAFFENNKIIADSILIKEYTYFPEDLIDLNPKLIPDFRIKTLNDTTYQLFVVEPDSSLLYSYILNREAEIKNIEKYSIPNSFDVSEYDIPRINTLNISNFSDSCRALFLATSMQNHHSNYLYYFTEQGSLLNAPYIDTTSVFSSDYFIFKTGNETFLNPSSRENDIYANLYQNFLLQDSIKIGQINNIKDANVFIPNNFELLQNYPNPFNSKTAISFSISKPDFVKLTIFDNRGQKIKRVVEKSMPAGSYKVNIDLNDIASGLYYYQLKTFTGYKVRKMLLIK